MVTALIFLAIGIAIIAKIYKDYKKKKIQTIGKKTASALLAFIAIILIAFGGFGNIIRIFSETGDQSTNTNSSTVAESPTPTKQEIIENCASSVLSQAEPNSGITATDATNLCTCTTNAYIQQYGGVEKFLELVKSGDPQAVAFKDQTDKTCLSQAGLVTN